MKIKEGKLPINARITIDYEHEDPKIKFSYPKQNMVEQNRHFTFFLFMILVLIILAYFSARGFPFIDYYDVYPTSCDIQEGRNGTIIKNMTIECDNGIKRNILFTQHYRTENKYFNYLTSISRSEDSGFIVDYTEIPPTQKLIVLSFLITFSVAWFLIIPYFLSIPSTKLLLKWGWFKKKIPKINSAIQGRCNKAIFKKIPDNLIIEIPFFKNVQMDYNATGDFSKYLKRVEIKEHLFNRVLVRRGKIKKRKKNIAYWYARFYFSQTAKKGKLEVMFK